MTQIEDGKGSGNRAEVNAEQQLVVRAITLSEIEHESEDHGLSYTWTSGNRDIDAADTLLLLKNTSDTELHIDSVILSSGNAATRYTIHLPTTEVTVTGTTITGINLNTASSNVADASAAADEENNSQGDIIADISLLTTTSFIVPLLGLILGKNKSLGIDQVTESTAGNATIIGHYAD